MSGGEYVIHLRHVVLVEEVIRVEDQISVVVLFSVILEDLVEEIVQRVPLSDLFGRKTLVYYGSGFARTLRRVVGAVVRADERVDQLGGVVLLFDAVDQIVYDVAFVTGGDYYRIAVSVVGGVFLRLFDQRDQNIYELISVAYREEDRKDQIYNEQIFHFYENLSAYIVFVKRCRGICISPAAASTQIARNTSE